MSTPDLTHEVDVSRASGRSGGRGARYWFATAAMLAAAVLLCLRLEEHRRSPAFTETTVSNQLLPRLRAHLRPALERLPPGEPIGYLMPEVFDDEGEYLNKPDPRLAAAILPHPFVPHADTRFVIANIGKREYVLKTPGIERFQVVHKIEAGVLLMERLP